MYADVALRGAIWVTWAVRKPESKLCGGRSLSRLLKFADFFCNYSDF